MICCEMDNSYILNRDKQAMEIKQVMDREMERDWQIKKLWRVKAFNTDSCSPQIVQISVTTCTAWKKKEMTEKNDPLLNHCILKCGGMCLFIYRGNLRLEDSRKWKKTPQNGIRGQQYGNGMSVMFQVYTNRKRMYIPIKYHTSTKCNINTAVIIKFHMICKEACSSSVPMSCPWSSHTVLLEFGLLFSRKASVVV